MLTLRLLATIAGRGKLPPPPLPSLACQRVSQRRSRTVMKAYG